VAIVVAVVLGYVSPATAIAVKPLGDAVQDVRACLVRRKTPFAASPARPPA